MGNPSSWGDLLTNYDGTNISYDSIGNPTNWRNSSSLTWDGRTLTSQTLTNGNSITYKYNSDGIRTQKRVFDDVASAYIIHDYVLDGSKILSETVTDNAYYNSYTLYYIYDASGSITGLHYNDQPYYFQKNIQGDILRILDRTGTVVVEYTYDAWGNILSVTGSMASTLGQYNPFRYRGYYYDSETGLYYLNSRYYDAEVGRFINADSYVSTGQGILGFNMFAYCLNNPVKYVDNIGSKANDSVVEKSPRSASTSREIYFTFFTVTVNLSVEYTKLPEFTVTLSSADISYSDGELSIELPDGETLSFEVGLNGIKPDSISFSTGDSTYLYDSNFVLDRTGVGFEFIISTDDVELSGTITFRPSLNFDSNNSSDGGLGLGVAVAIGFGAAAAGMGFGSHTLQPQRADFCTVSTGF